MVKQNKVSWIGNRNSNKGILGKANNNNFFKSTNKKHLPVNMFKDNDRDGVMNVFDCKPNNPKKQGLIDTIVNWSDRKNYPTINPKKVQQIVEKNRILSIAKKGLRKENIQNVANKIQNVADNVSQRLSKGKQRVITRKGYTPQERHSATAIKKLIQSTVPGIPMSATQSGRLPYQGKTGKRERGRPVGSVKYPGGIYAWRKLMRAQKAAAKYQVMQQQINAMQQYPKMEAARQMQMQQQQYQQVPQEMEGLEEEYQQVPQIPQQYQQYQQQMPQEPQKRPIATVFKSSGGSPYPPVNSRPLANARQTIPQGYIEDVDSFTGRRFIKKLPPSERWSTGG